MWLCNGRGYIELIWLYMYIYNGCGNARIMGVVYMYNGCGYACIMGVAIHMYNGCGYDTQLNE